MSYSKKSILQAGISAVILLYLINAHQLPDVNREGRSLSQQPASDRATRARVTEAYGKLPLRFEANAGQTADGSALIYSTYLGGSDSDVVEGGIALDPDGCAYLFGFTTSNNFPLMNPLQSTNSGVVDTFITKLSADGLRSSTPPISAAALTNFPRASR